MNFKYKPSADQIVSFIILTFFFILIFRFCEYMPEKHENKPPPPPIKQTAEKIKRKHVNIDSINDVIKKQSIYIDSLKKSYKKDLTALKRYYNTLVKTAPDTCGHYLAMLANKCDSMNKDCANIISEYEEKDALNRFKDSANAGLIDLYRQQINNYITLDSTKTQQIKSLEQQVKKEKRKGLFNLFKGGAVGFGIGYLTGKVI
jgi:hypothetical protein